MWKIAFGVFVAVVCVAADKATEKYDDPRLPTALHVAGIVLDQARQPIAGATIDHTDIQHQVFKTDSEGKFSVDTRAPALVIRRAGFRSELFHPQKETEVRVTLLKQTPLRTFPACPSGGAFEGIDGWDAELQFPMIVGMKPGRQITDADYGARHYDIKTKRSRRGIMHASGSFWSWGKPLDADIWRSVTYEEVSLDAGAETLLDARGRFSNGNRWRTLGKPGESAFYSDVEEATAKLLDQVLDGGCLKPAPHR